MTNFSELKKQNPLSFRLFEQWVEQNYGSSLFIHNGSGIVRNDSIIEFLDERMICVFEAYDKGNKRWTWLVWSKHEDEIIEDSIMSNFKKRNEATSEAIKKAFELLENKLKQN